MSATQKKETPVEPTKKKELHPDSQYLMQKQIGPVIAKGLATVYREKPKNPVDFFAKWLLHQSNLQKRNAQEEKIAQNIDKLKTKESYAMANTQKEIDEADKKKKEMNDQIEAFKKKVKDSDDLLDMLPELVQHLKQFTGATASYIGVVDKPIKGVKDGLKEDEDDKAHLIVGAKPQISILHASEEYKEILKDKVLLQKEGVTFNLFKDDVTSQTDPTVVDASKDNLPKHIFIEEVVRNKKMKYFQVPKLGSYMAIKLEYESCMFEQAYDAAVKDYSEINDKVKEQDIEKKEYEEEMKEREEDGEERDSLPAKEWDAFHYAKFKTFKKQYVVCLNTMGQDRVFTDEEQKFALETVRLFQWVWEKREDSSLEKDVKFKLANADFDRFYKDNFEQQDETEIQKIIEETHIAENANKNDMGEDELTENEKEALARIVKFKELTKGFWAPDSAKEYQEKMSKTDGIEVPVEVLPKAEVAPPKPKSVLGSARGSNQEEEEAEVIPPFTPLIPEFWKSKCMDFGNLHIVKFERILQSLFYLLHDVSREDICEKETNKFSWKLAQKLFISGNDDSIYKEMNNYWPIGPKDGEYKEYQKIRFIKENVEAIDENEVDEYSMTLGKLYRWLLMALELRIEDVTNRRRAKDKEREYRTDAIDRESERKERLDAGLAEEKEAYEAKQAEEKEQAEEQEEADAEKKDKEEEVPFDEEAFKENFDEENPPIEQPADVIDDIDNDFNIEIEPEEDD